MAPRAKLSTPKKRSVDKPRSNARAVGSLTIPGRNGGRLRNGGTNKGGPGRPPSAIREIMRLALVDQIPVLVDIARGDPVVKIKSADGQDTGTTVSATPGDRIRAIETLARYGLGTQVEVPTDGDGNALAPQVIVIGGREVRF